MHNPEDFRFQKKDVINYFTRKEVTEGNISEFCSLCMIPIVAVCTFIMEEMPEHKELCERKIREINEFYK